MAKQTPTTADQGHAQDREDRLKAALKANLQRRKTQARARAAQRRDENMPQATENED